MKKIIAVCLVLVLCFALWFWGYYSRKSNDNIPSKELMVSYCQNQGEDYAVQQLQSYKNTQLMEVWGQPDGSLFGFWGDIWETNNTCNLIVYYDSDGIVAHVKVMDEDSQEAGQEMQFPSAQTSTADAESVTENLAVSNAVNMCQFVKDCLGEPDSFQIHAISYMEEKGYHYYYLDFSHEVKKEEMERTYYFAEFDGSALLCIVNENSAIHYQTDGDYTKKYQVLSAMFREESSEQLDAELIASNLA